MRIILTGRVGTKKSRLISSMYQLFDFDEVLQATTARKNGSYYKQVDRETFSTMEKAGCFVDTAEYAGEKYGTYELPSNSLSVFTPDSALFLREKYGEDTTRIVLLENSYQVENSPQHISDGELDEAFSELVLDPSVIKIDATQEYSEVAKDLSEVLEELGCDVGLKPILYEISKHMDLKSDDQVDFLVRYYEASLLTIASTMCTPDYGEDVSQVTKDLDKWISNKLSMSESKDKISALVELNDIFTKEIQLFRGA